MSKTIKIINDELVEIASYRNPKIVFHDSNNPRHLEPEYDNFESYCDFKEVINPFELYAENQQLKKQKDDVVEFIKKEKSNYMRGCDLTKTTNTEGLILSSAVRTCDELLRMLGEIDETDNLQ